MKQLILIPLTVLLCITMANAGLIAVDQPKFTQGWANEAQGDYRAHVTFTVKNTGTAVEQGIFELTLRQMSYAIVLERGACDPYQTPYTRHVYYLIYPGEQQKITIDSGMIPHGTFEAKLAHVTGCCTDGINALACNSKEPFGWGQYLGTVSNQPTGQLITCNWDANCEQILKTEGTFNCVKPVCINKGTSSSDCVCSAYGECSTGEEQGTVCEDGVTLIVRRCINAKWELTGNRCQDENIPPEPVQPGGVGGIPKWTLPLIGLALGALIVSWLGPFSMLVGGTVGLVLGLVVMFVI